MTGYIRVSQGGDPDREPPFFFTKPPDAICDSTSEGTSNCRTPDMEGRCVVPYPPMTSLLHFEGELVVAIGKGGLRIPEGEAEDHIYGYAVGCDLTRRDLQADAKKMGRPWDAAKGFDFSAPCGPIVPKEEVVLGLSDVLTLELNRDTRQRSTLEHMIWGVPETLSYLSNLFRLKPGDLIMMGTPAGVDKLEEGDFVNITCGSLPPCQFYIGSPEI